MIGANHRYGFFISPRLFVYDRSLGVVDKEKEEILSATN